MMSNPYQISNPVSEIGLRKNLLNQLELLLGADKKLTSVLLYGARRIGKTTLLKTLDNALGEQIKVIYVNLQCLGTVSQGIAEVLMAISDEIATAFNISSPDDDAFLKLPQRTFERYLKQVIGNMPYRGLIIALDEFETIEELIQRGQIEPYFMGFLRGLVHKNSEKIAFVFAGFHTLEEMTADYFQPWLDKLVQIKISYLDFAETCQILTVSGLKYTEAALSLIYSLTSGQPYLTQLIGFLLVRNQNDQVFEQGNPQDNTLTVKDIKAVINNNFFQQGRYYFEGVWGQAAQGVTGQQAIIKALAAHPQGLNLDKLLSITGLDTATLETAIATLIRHDVIQEEDSKYCIAVELFRLWIK